MTAYADTGFLCSLYAPDAHTPRAVARMRLSLPLAFTWLHQLELRNALRLRVFRRDITSHQKDASLNATLADLAEGVLIAAAPPLAGNSVDPAGSPIDHAPITSRMLLSSRSPTCRYVAR